MILWLVAVLWASAARKVALEPRRLLHGSHTGLYSRKLGTILLKLVIIEYLCRQVAEQRFPLYLREGFKELENKGEIKVEGHNTLLKWTERAVYTDTPDMHISDSYEGFLILCQTYHTPRRSGLLH